MGGHSPLGALPNVDPESELYKNNMRFRNRFIFCLGAIARVDQSMQNYFLQAFLLEIAKVPPSYVGAIMILRKVWDGFMDPIIGTISDSENTPIGRRKPWVYLCAVPMTVYWVLQWMLQPWGEVPTSLYFLYVLLIYSTCHTVQAVPYRALIPDVALTYNTRSSVATWMQGLNQISAVISVSLTAWIIEKYPSEGYLYAALLALPFVGFPRVLAVSVVMERKVEKEEDKESVTTNEIEIGEAEKGEMVDVDLKEGKGIEDDDADGGVREIQWWEGNRVLEFFHFWFVRERDFTIVMLACFAISIASAMVMANFLFFIRLVFDIYSLTIPLFLQTFSSILSLPIWFMIMKRIGKNKTFIISGCVMFVAMMMLALAPKGTSTYMIWALNFFFGFSNALPLIIQAMIPDSVSAYEKSTGRRDEAFLFSLSLLAMKFGQAVGLAVSSFSLAAAGYNANLHTQPPGVGIVLRFLTFGAPALLVIVCCILIYFANDFSSMTSHSIVPTNPTEGEGEREKEIELVEKKKEEE